MRIFDLGGKREAIVVNFVMPSWLCLYGLRVEVELCWKLERVVALSIDRGFQIVANCQLSALDHFDECRSFIVLRLI